VLIVATPTHKCFMEKLSGISHELRISNGGA